MKKYKYTENWLSSGELTEILINISNINPLEEMHILEIGSFEGRSTVWFLEKLLQNKKSTITCIDPWLDYALDKNSLNSYGPPRTKTMKTFHNNLKESGQKEKVNVLRGFSYEKLPKLIIENKIYDIIFIDGNHTAPFVLMDATMSWPLLKKGGVIIFDDYKWGINYKEGGKRKTQTIKETLRPAIAINAFEKNFNDYVEVIWDKWTKSFKRIK